jgi:hypothetical protein
MPDPERLLTTLRRAADACGATPGRRGHVVAPADCDEVLVAGDLHGHLGNFQAVLKQADLGANPRRHLVVQELVHGPFRYPVGGDKSHQLVDLVAALKCEYPQRVHYLLGNHELSQWTNRHVEKNNEELTNLFRAGVETAYRDRADAVYAAYLGLFAALPVALRTPNRVFVSHSLPSARRLDGFNLSDLEKESFEPSDLALGGSVHALVWGRDTSAANAASFLQKVDADLLISGHIPCDRGFFAPNDRQLVLDALGATACYCLFPTGRALTHPELLDFVRTL